MSPLAQTCLAIILAVSLTEIAAVGSKCSASERFNCLGANTKCVDGICECKTGYVGNPYVGCIADAHVVCTLVNDPRGRTFAGEPELKGIDIPLPCRYIAAHVDTIDHSLRNNPLSMCTTRVYTAEERFNGKFFISGFEAIVDYTTSSGTRHFSFRTRGTAMDELYEVYPETRPSGGGEYSAGDNIDRVNNEIGGINIFGWDDATKSMRLYIEYCGIELHFRAADFNGNPQINQPGMVLGVNERDFTVDYHSLSSSFCLTSDVHERSVSTVVEINKMDADHAFTFQAIAANILQNFPNTASEKCAAVSDILANQCVHLDRNAKAMENCGFILEEPRFVNCYNGDDKHTSDATLELFTLCMEAFCTQDVDKCHIAQGMVNNHHCRHNANYVFIGFSCDFHPMD